MEMDSWFCLYPSDLLSDTERLSPHDFGAYVRLLCAYYKSGPLPNDQEDLRLMSRVEKADWVRCWGRLEPYFTLGEDGLLHQKRADRELENRSQRQKKIREASALGVAARREKGQLPASDGSTGGSTGGSTDGLTDDRTQPDSQTARQPQLQVQSHPDRKRVRFAPPSLEEVKLQGSKIGLPVLECEKFISYYESNGWKVGRNGMKSWQAAMTHWKTNWIERNNGQTTRVSKGHNQQNPRNAGITQGPTDYAEAFKRKRERQDAEYVAREMAKAKDQSPAASEATA